ncbi:hypothetical protein E2C01_074142 [Portunus trituberculatus]|uniref:Uncharacterized protein n=1 Tax=Portunus trituberculatus TaxID=210409 RepID=A0A5B7ICH0_PORTR|nr:hypothetical protein [Portunus trituberculatus]
MGKLRSRTFKAPWSWGRPLIVGALNVQLFYARESERSGKIRGLFYALA